MEPGTASDTAAATQVRARLLHYLRYTRGVEPERANLDDLVAALQLTVREGLIDRLGATRTRWRTSGAKSVCYLSMEFLVGPLLRNNLLATGLAEPARHALAGLGRRLEDVLDAEPDPGLGNGGLGRLAACFLDSLATLDIPAWGYGLRYDYGIFRQEIEGGWQVERPDRWLDGGYAWEIARPDLTVEAPLGGEIAWRTDEAGRAHPVWNASHRLLGVPHDVLVAGHGTPSVAVLRLWKAEAPDEFDFETFSRGDFLAAVAPRERAEAITKVLYPSDAVEAGRRLRLMQEYFLVACTVRDVARRFRAERGEDWRRLPEAVALQLNDTHPALAVAELMRLLLDDAALPWDAAWDLTRACCGYTNHTLRPEALESWPIALVQQLLPRHTQIIYDINQHLLAEVGRHHPGDIERLRRVSLVEENGDKRFRMAHLAVAGSHRINGVSRLHTDLLTRHVLPEFVALWPERFVSITNGITPRRWLSACNPRLAGAITSRIGVGWERDLDRLAELAGWADNAGFQDEFLAIKAACKADLIDDGALGGLRPDPDALFDVQIKRMHEYKRQLLLALHVIALYRRIKSSPGLEIVPRVVIVGGKAAPAYHMAKLIIRLLNGIAAVVNRDPDVAGRLVLAFVPDYRVSLAERIIPAADLSEQISTAGTEASGTGNMKLALNGAVTIGTLDGANIEIREAVGAENFFTFGASPDEAERLLAPGGHDPRRVVAADAELAGVLEDLRRGVFAGGDESLLRPIWSSLVESGDHYLNLADFRSYVDAQRRVEALFRDRRAWASTAIRNIAAMGRFSSDRAVREYAHAVWGVAPLDESTAANRAAGADLAPARAAGGGTER